MGLATDTLIGADEVVYSLGTPTLVPETISAVVLGAYFYIILDNEFVEFKNHERAVRVEETNIFWIVRSSVSGLGHPDEGVRRNEGGEADARLDFVVRPGSCGDVYT